MKKDVLGNPLGELEQEVYSLYESLKTLAANEDAPPCVTSNAKKALTCLWQAANAMNLPVEQLYDLGV